MLELFETPLTVLHIFVCLFLILVVLIQPGKSGGLGAALGGAGAQQVFGGRGAGNFLSRATWICASTFFVTSMVLAYISSSADDSLEGRADSEESKSATADKDADKGEPAKEEGAAAPAAVLSAPAANDEPAGNPADEPAAALGAEVQPGAEAQPNAGAVNAAAPAVSLTVPSLSGLKPALLSTAAPTAPKPVVPPVAPLKPVAPTGAAIASPAVIPAPAKPAAPPLAVGQSLPNKSVPPALPLKPVTPAVPNPVAPATSN